MPIFEIICEDCNKTQEKLCKKLEDLDIKIDECETEVCKARLVFSAPSLSFKGTGFYVTDYKKIGISK
jgi:predicted nucleic acid-binding Zn ribbon protein